VSAEPGPRSEQSSLAVDLYLEKVRMRDLAIASRLEVGVERGKVNELEEIVANLKQKISLLESEVQYHANFVDVIYASETWKVGRTVLAPVRALKHRKGAGS
jgi:hypothetical protein